MLLLAALRRFHTGNVLSSQNTFHEDQLVAKSVLFNCQPRRSLGRRFYLFYSYLMYPVKTVQCSNVLAQSSGLKEHLVCLQVGADLEELVLQSHFRLRLQTNASAEDVGQCRTLLSQSVHNGSARRGQRSLEHVAEDAEDAVELLELSSLEAVIGSSLPLDTGHHLSNHHEVNNQGRGQERVLADIEQPISS